MKKFISLCLILLCSILSFAQTTNTFPTSGNVGIGTASPSIPLHIYSRNDAILRLQNPDGGWNYLEFYNSSSRTWFLGTNNSEFFTIGNVLNINNDGNVGIGTISSSFKLDVKASSNSSATIVSRNAAGGISAFMNVNNDGSGSFYARGSDNTINTVSINGGGNSYLNGGNVGIGTKSPSNSLTLSNISNGANLARITFDGQTGDANNTINGGVEFHNDNYSFYSAVLGYRGNFSHEVGLLFKTSYHDNSGITAMTIVPSGNVGIGTSNPGAYKLAVEGIIGAREVKITTDSWADFVFKPNYNLRPLSEVEQFIKINNHLPEIPSEAEVKVNGIGLGEMNAKLLQKIEELTLYLIEKDKENKLQDQQIKILQDEIKELKQIKNNN